MGVTALVGRARRPGVCIHSVCIQRISTRQGVCLQGACIQASMRLVACLLVVLLLGCARPASPLPPAPAAAPTPVPPVSFPNDAGPHEVLTEWWYYTGHLATPSGRPFGFEFTIFQIRRQDAPTVYIGHFAVSDVAGRRFVHQARFAEGEPQLMPLDVQGWRLSSEPGTDSIQAAMADGPSLRLRLSDEKPPALHHGGYIDEGPAGGSYYYSRTRLAAAGELALDGATPAPVSGLAWMDHQWGNFIVPSTGGWDWYSLQLDDRTELMLYVLHFPGLSRTVYGSLVHPDGRVEELSADTVQVQPTGEWTSPHTGALYPSGWRLTLPSDQVLELEPRLADQELYFPEARDSGTSVPAYWEGAVSVRGAKTGQGYVELTGYAK
jgi:predicted secreted hydrolase